MEALNEIHSLMLYSAMNETKLDHIRELYRQAQIELWDYWQVYDADQRARFGDDRPAIVI